MAAPTTCGGFGVLLPPPLTPLSTQMTPMKHFDCVVIGTGPAGQKGAIQAAKLGKRVAIIEKNSVLGGAQINTGTIPSKALREAVLHLTGTAKRGLFGSTYRLKKEITIADLVSVSQTVIRHEWELIQNQFERNNVELLWDKATFAGPNELFVEGRDQVEKISADKFLIGVGTRPARPDDIPFNAHTILTSDELLKLDHLPKSMIVVGGGVIGTEYACIMATLGVKVTLVEGAWFPRPRNRRRLPLFHPPARHLATAGGKSRID